MNDAPTNDAVFSMNAALNSALLTLNAGRIDTAPGLDREGAYLYARGLRHEVSPVSRFRTLVVAIPISLDSVSLEEVGDGAAPRDAKDGGQG